MVFNQDGIIIPFSQPSRQNAVDITKVYYLVIHFSTFERLWLAAKNHQSIMFLSKLYALLLCMAAILRAFAVHFGGNHLVS